LPDPSDIDVIRTLDTELDEEEPLDMDWSPKTATLPAGRAAHLFDEAPSTEART
jgi:hypothetical protein